MLTLKSSYTFPAAIVIDTPVVSTSGYNTVCFDNQGQQTVVINGTYKIKPGLARTFGGRVNGTVEQSFAITFTGVGTKELYLIEETIAKV